MYSLIHIQFKAEVREGEEHVGGCQPPDVALGTGPLTIIENSFSIAIRRASKWLLLQKHDHADVREWEEHVGDCESPDIALGTCTLLQGVGLRVYGVASREWYVGPTP